jgi:hypothetical protein
MRYSLNATVRSEISTYDTGSEFVRALCSLTEEADTPLAVATITSELYDIYADHDSLPSVIIKKAHVISRQLETVSAGSGSLQNAHLLVNYMNNIALDNAPIALLASEINVDAKQLMGRKPTVTGKVADVHALIASLRSIELSSSSTAAASASRLSVVKPVLRGLHTVLPTLVRSQSSQRFHLQLQLAASRTHRGARTTATYTPKTFDVVDKQLMKRWIFFATTFSKLVRMPTALPGQRPSISLFVLSSTNSELTADAPAEMQRFHRSRQA